VGCIPKGRKQALYGQMRSCLGPVLRAWAEPRGSTIVEGQMVQDHGHRLSRMPPQYAVAEVIGSSTGKRALAVARQCGGRPSNLHGERFWA
jgi:REP element-mobilizing transposase RayT